MRLAVVATVVAALGAAALGASASPGPHGQRCRSADLRIHFVKAQGAAAMEISEFQFVNASRRGCDLIGYPGAKFYGRDGQELSVKVKRASLRDKDPKLVTLKPGGRTGFLTNTAAFAPSKGGCEKADFVHFTPPAGGSELPIRHQLLICNGEMQIGPVGQG